MERLLDPLDSWRRVTLAGLLRVPGLGAVLRRRDARLLLQTSLGATVAFTLTLAAPGALLVLGPLCMGVLHVAADVRYLVVRRGVPARVVSAVLLASVALFSLRVAAMLGAPAGTVTAAEVGLGFSLPLIVLALSPSRRAALVAVPLLAVLGLALSAPGRTQLVFAYAHNVVGLLAWGLLFRRRRLIAAPALGLAASGALLLASGALLPVARLTGPWAERVVDEAMMAMPLAEPRRAIGVGLSFLFLQALHYSAWLSWVPQDDLPGEGTTTFRMSARSFARDLGRPLAAGVVALALIVAAAGVVAPHPARHVYLSLATFHGYLELAMLAFLVARPTGLSR
ncbi:MAG: hypothetical protein IT374_09195 [Polyangiaceae bacterium]|nr:hypothetical protein [Polyangiaceae bacterium]